MNEVSVLLLKPHPKNREYYSDLRDAKYEEIKRSIEAHGIRDPLKVLPDHTIIAGHRRLKIAQELGLEKVPVTIWDVPPEEAEYMLIADNEERRQSDDDPIRKAKRAKFLKEYWGARQGKKRQNVVESSGKSLADVAEAIGEDIRTAQRLLKLNDLIEPLQSLVSVGKLSQTAAYSLAFLPSEEQKNLLNTLGESGVCGLSVTDAKELRRELETNRKQAEELQSQLVELEEEKRELVIELANLKDILATAEEKIAAKVGERYGEKFQQAVADLERKEAEAEKLRQSISSLKTKLTELKNAPPRVIEKVVEKIPEDYPKLKQELEKKNAELLALTRSQLLQKDRYKIHDMFSALVQAVGKHLKQIELEIARNSGDVEIYKDAMECADLLEKAAKEVRRWVKQERGVIIEADFTTRS